MSIDQRPRVAGLVRRSRRRAPADQASAEETPQAALPPRIPGRRNPRWIALGVVAICLGGLLSYVVYARVATQSTVIALAATVYRGEVVEASDLKTITVNGDVGVPTVPGPALDGLVGQRAAYDLVEGAILPPGGISAVAMPAQRRSIVGIKLSAGRVPLGYLQPGSVVRMVVVPPPNAEAGFRDGYSGKNYPGIVVDQQAQPDAASTTLVNLDVLSSQAGVVALLAATDRLALVRDADR